MRLAPRGSTQHCLQWTHYCSRWAHSTVDPNTVQSRPHGTAADPLFSAPLSIFNSFQYLISKFYIQQHSNFLTSLNKHKLKHILQIKIIKTINHFSITYINLFFPIGPTDLCLLFFLQYHLFFIPSNIPLEKMNSTLLSTTSHTVSPTPFPYNISLLLQVFPPSVYSPRFCDLPCVLATWDPRNTVHSGPILFTVGPTSGPTQHCL